jgi:hypothetical protein
MLRPEPLDVPMMNHVLVIAAEGTTADPWVANARRLSVVHEMGCSDPSSLTRSAIRSQSAHRTMRTLKHVIVPAKKARRRLITVPRCSSQRLRRPTSLTRFSGGADSLRDKWTGNLRKPRLVSGRVVDSSTWPIWGSAVVAVLGVRLDPENHDCSLAQRHSIPERKRAAPIPAISAAAHKSTPPPSVKQAIIAVAEITNNGRPTSHRQLTADLPGGVLKVRLSPQRSRDIALDRTRL